MTTKLLSLPLSSLIICTRNRPLLLHETLTSVLKGDGVPSEIVVIDQSAQFTPLSNLAEQTRGCEIRHLPSSTTGLCRARNIGIAAAHHHLLIFIDDDMFVAEDWFGTLVHALVESGERTVVTGRVLPTDEGGSDGFVPSLVLSETPQLYVGRLNTDVLAAGHMAMHRSLYETVGPFDEDLGAGTHFPASDDNDYGYRLLQAGFRIRYLPEAVVFHRAWRRASDYWQLRWGYGRGKGGFYAKHLRWHDRHMLARLLRDVGVRLIRFPWRFLHRPKLALGDLPYLAGVLTGVKDWLWIHRKAR